MDRDDLTPNTSVHRLAGNSGDNDSATTLLQEKQSRRRDNLSEVTILEYITVAILCYVNLINYMDRFTIAGILHDITDTFEIKDDEAGLLQTVFVLSYMVFAPIFGYLGDRHSRRLIMAFGVAMWSLTTFIGSYMTNFYWFMLFRCLVGIGEASYSTIAPTIISDLFVGNLRSKMLAVFYFAIPVGSGLGYIVGSATGALAGNWRWGLRVTPFLGAIAVALISWVMTEPERGQAEESHMQATSYKEDLRSLLKNRSFMLSTAAFTCVAFVTGALAWWGPQFIYHGLKLQPGMQDVTSEKVALTFGTLTMFSGVVGVPIGVMLANNLVKRWPRSHPVICGVGLLVSAPMLGVTLLAADRCRYLQFVSMFIAEVALNLNWAIVADIALYVVVPPRRSTAEAFQILISHMFGDAGSPYLVGVISEAVKRYFLGGGNSLPSDLSPVQEFKSLQYGLFIMCFIEVLGGIFFLLTAIYIIRDKASVDRAIAEAEAQRAEPSHVYAQDPETSQ